ncbi:MAG: helix-turn-helix transcriptional regulator [Dehalococcoidales bacterium]|jgi:transcriptional regulator with XRE-family HTH domain
MQNENPLNAYRLDKGMSIAELAREIGISRGVLARYFDGLGIADYHYHQIRKYASTLPPEYSLAIA